MVVKHRRRRVILHDEEVFGRFVGVVLSLCSTVGLVCSAVMAAGG
jgi:hypothetical protein